MDERQQQFRVGLLTLLAVVLTFGMVFQFGEIGHYFEKTYTVGIHFQSAAGVHKSSDVTLNGIPVGRVQDVRLDQRRGGVLVIAAIRAEFKIRSDSIPTITSSLLGDSGIDFQSGRSQKALKAGDIVKGQPPADPMRAVARLESSVGATLKEWQLVGKNLNSLVSTNRGNLDTVLERTAEALGEFTLTMRSANETLGQANVMLSDPRHRKSLEAAVTAIPELVNETRDAVRVVRLAVGKVDSNLTNLSDVTGPLAKNSQTMMLKLTRTISNLDSLTTELSSFTGMLSAEDGSLKKLISDPSLYRNLNQSAAGLAVLMKNADPILRDLRVFSDKVARHPELIGVRGAFRGSSGLKEVPPERGTVPARNAAWPGGRQ